MPTEELNTLHLAELHERAAEAGIDGYRLLRRDELIERLGSEGDSGRRRPRRRKAPDVDLESDTSELEAVSDDKPADEESSEEERPARRRRGGRGRGGRGRERLESRGDDERGDDREDGETRDVVGVLEVTRQRHGFLQLTGEHEGEPDVYVSAAQVRRCELSDGDEVSGPAREPRRGERHPALVHVDKVNGEDPVAEPDVASKSRGASKSGFEIAVPEAELEDAEGGKIASSGEGWFVLNARDARWWESKGRGRGARFIEQGYDGQQVAVNLIALDPGEIMGTYHWEADQEGFFVLSGEAILIVEGEERPLRSGDYFHCPVNTSHVIVGAGETTCTVFAFGAQEHQDGDGWGGYPVEEKAIEHKAGVEEQTTSAEEAYAGFEDRKPVPYKPGWMPGDE